MLGKKDPLYVLRDGALASCQLPPWNKWTLKPCIWAHYFPTSGTGGHFYFYSFSHSEARSLYSHCFYDCQQVQTVAVTGWTQLLRLMLLPLIRDFNLKYGKNMFWMTHELVISCHFQCLLRGTSKDHPKSFHNSPFYSSQCSYLGKSTNSSPWIIFLTTLCSISTSW